MGNERQPKVDQKVSKGCTSDTTGQVFFLSLFIEMLSPICLRWYPLCISWHMNLVQTVHHVTVYMWIVGSLTNSVSVFYIFFIIPSVSWCFIYPFIIPTVSVWSL